MVKIEAPTLEEALILAAKELSCSVADVEYEIIEQPKKGFWGIGKKAAKIVATIAPVSAIPVIPEREMRRPLREHRERQEVIRPSGETRAEPKRFSLERRPKERENPREKERDVLVASARESSLAPKEIESPPRNTPSASLATSKRVDALIDSNFFKEKNDIDRIAQEVEDEVNLLFLNLPFKIERIRVRPFDETTLFIEFKGEDSALLIGKEGYRYKALSYLLFNWVNSKYGFMIRLEIAEFLKNQEEMIRNYLSPVIENIKKFGRGQTRPLDGVLAHIALKQLREEFPDKYVSFRLNSDNERYVIVNDFNK
ncbi:Jag N-terminal domain-containing protein [Wolinella succinogenes]|uniref:Jag N-terminal domain-containing protein n=1 Tax=Wolinella succinogenes TaxID=844 RepID=UPI0024093422|nr:Jag N-terminal domain-containing protein [Wolinella succinogenes]